VNDSISGGGWDKRVGGCGDVVVMDAMAAHAAGRMMKRLAADTEFG
jgi:hypothetical protein